MKLFRVIVFIALVLSLLASFVSAGYAHGRDDGRGRDYGRHERIVRYYQPPVRYYRPAPPRVVYYEPVPVYYRPYYAPVYQQPYYGSSVGFSFNFR